MDWTDLIGQLIEMVESTAPALWKIAQQQVMADMAGRVFWMLFLSVLAVVCYRLLRRWWVAIEKCSKSEEDFYGAGIVATSLISLVCAIIVPLIVSGVIKRLINPDYYALKLLIGMMTGGN